MPTQAGGALGDGKHRPGPQSRIGHDTTGTHLTASHFKLRLHHGNDIGVRGRAGGQRGQHCGQRDERQVRDHQIDCPADGVRCQFADIGPFDHPHPVIGSQRPRELSVSHIHRDHLGRTAIQQHLGESTGGRTGIQTAPAGNIDAEVLERADQLVRAAGDPGAFSGALDGKCCSHLDGGRRFGGGHPVDGDPAGADQFRGLLSGPGQPTTDQLSVHPGAPRHAQLSSSRPIPAR